MHLTLSIVRQFAIANSHLRWHTESQGKPFTLAVHDGKLTFSISTGNERYLTDADIERICDTYNQTGSLRPKDYQGITYNSSYILAVFRSLLTGPDNQPVFALDIDPPEPDRVHAWVSRIIRDTSLAIEVKKLHNYQCQVCGGTIELPDGSRYAEAHHVKPLGGKHCGPDIKKNVLCLCPNCHTKCDLGAIEISLPDLRTIDGHQVAVEFVDYHNTRIYAGWPDRR